MAISRSQLLKELLPGLNALFGMEYARYGEEHKEIYASETSERSFEEETKLSGFSAAPVKNEGSAIAPSIVFLAPSSWIRPWCRNSQPCLIAEKAPCASMRRENGSTSYMPKNLWMNVAAVPGPSKTQAITAYNKYSILVMRFSPSRNVRSMLL